MSLPNIPRRAIALLLIFLIGIWFGPLDFRKLIKPDEGRYAEIPREMAASGDWVTPRLNGIKYFEKPPLQYWATATAFTLAGEHDWTARLWPALTGFLGILLAAFTARRLFGPRAAVIAAAIQASALLYLGIGHINTLDMGLTFFLQLAISSFLLAQHAPVGAASERHWMWAAWAAAACAALSKGLVSLVLPGATLVAYSLLTRDFVPWRRLHILSGLALFLLIAAPWHIAASIANPEFAHFYFIHEHVLRFLTKTHGRYQPMWYFIPVLAVGALPWTGMMIHAALQAWKPTEGASPQAPRFLLLWSVITFCFFSASSSKLASYVLPVIPALALLAASWATRLTPRILTAHLVSIVVVAVVAVAALSGITRFADVETPSAMIAAYGVWLKASAWIWLAGGVVALVLSVRKQVTASLLALSVSSLIAWTGVIQGHEMLGRSNSSYFLVQEVKSQIPPDVPFFSVNMYEQTLPYYLQRTVTLVDYRDEMGFGLDQEPQRSIPTEDAFMAAWKAAPQAWAVMTPTKFDELQDKGLPMHIAARDTRRVIVKKP